MKLKMIALAMALAAVLYLRFFVDFKSLLHWDALGGATAEEVAPAPQGEAESPVPAEAPRAASAPGDKTRH